MIRVFYNYGKSYNHKPKRAFLIKILYDLNLYNGITNCYKQFVPKHHRQTTKAEKLWTFG